VPYKLRVDSSNSDYHPTARLASNGKAGKDSILQALDSLTFIVKLRAVQTAATVLENEATMVAWGIQTFNFTANPSNLSPLIASSPPRMSSLYRRIAILPSFCKTKAVRVHHVPTQVPFPQGGIWALKTQRKLYVVGEWQEKEKSSSGNLQVLYIISIENRTNQESQLPRSMVTFSFTSHHKTSKQNII
jgi:hypothetical protein